MHTAAEPGSMTQLLAAIRDGDAAALERLLPHIYDELRVTVRRLRGRRSGAMTLDPAALVNDSYMKRYRTGALQPADRPHFLAVAARAMHQVLSEQARSALAQTREAGLQHAVLADDGTALKLAPDALLALDRVLAGLPERQRRIAQCRLFAGMDEKEIGAVLGVSDRTVRRDWLKTRAFVYADSYAGSSGPAA